MKILLSGKSKARLRSALGMEYPFDAECIEKMGLQRWIDAGMIIDGAHE